MRRESDDAASDATLPCSAAGGGARWRETSFKLAKTVSQHVVSSRTVPYTQARIRAPAFPTVRVRITAALLLAAVELRNIVETRAL
jgi:hypothetical protein